MLSPPPPSSSFRILYFLLVFCVSACHGRIFTFEMHHRYSDQVKIWSQKNARSNSSSSAAHWPARGSVEYYSELAERDRLFRGRRISEIEEPVTFSSGNGTVRISSLGFLHYTTVTLGTPGAKFLVALDTGSDLFWVPCDCNQCAPVKGTSYASDFDLSIYNPKDSSTSKKVNCNNSLCLLRNKCTGSANQCPYLISYVSAETSTSGILMEDVLHLTTEDHHREFVQAYITFGCGQVQTGSFLDVAVPNGLFGLGMEKISVPSLLSREGFTADSFSMCFSQDGVGRISFGDKGSPHQRETQFNFNPSHPTYNITVTQIRVGDSLVDLNFTALFDSGTSFTYLVDPAYSKLVESFHSQAKDTRRPADSRIPFEYCYDMSPEANTSLIASVTLTMNGGSQFSVYDPIIVISTQNELVYCLAVVKSTELNIIGQNFMTGYRVVFDREKLILGWEKSNCYNIQVFATSEEAGNTTHESPAASVEPKRSATNSDQGTENSSNGSRMFLLPPIPIMPPAAAAMISSLSPPPIPSAGGDNPPYPDDFTWYGNIQYLLNISSIGALFCVLVFFLVKLRSDHRRIPGPTALFSKLLAVWHATGREIARHCGADAAQFLIIEGGTFALLLATSFIAVLLILPVNLYAGAAKMDDQFSKTTITHIVKGSPALWFHFIFVVMVVLLAHYGICEIEKRLKITRLRDGYGIPSESLANTSAVFTVMVQGIPKNLASNKLPFEEYFQERYPGKVYRVIVPMDLCALDRLVEDLVEVRNEISKLVAKIDARLVYSENDLGEYHGDDLDDVSLNGTGRFWKKAKKLWIVLWVKLGYTDDERLRRLQELRAELETEVAAYKAGHAPGAGVAFVVFKDVYTANRAVKDFRTEKKSRIGRFFPIMELQLERNRWKVERAPLATDIYWNHLGTTTLSLKLRRMLVNTCLLLLLLFFSSPLAVISALTSAGRIINAEAMDNAQSWVAWLQSSSWIAALFFQFLPNVLVFVSMYILIPAALSYLSKFEQHLTVSGEQRAALIKMVCFFLVNLIVLRGLVESSLESALLSMGRCYLDGEDCKRIEQYMSASFLSKSCLSTLAFLITCTFLGISYDLLAPIPWIKSKLQKFKKNDMLQLVPEQTEDYSLDGQEIDGLQRPLISDEAFANGGPLNVIDLQGQDLSIHPLSKTSPVPKQTFDFAQYHAFNLTIFALTMIYSSFAPLVLPVGAVYFGYRYIVDKYNFLFVYRVRGFPAGNDGRLMDTVLSIMRFCVDLFLLSMLLFFSVRGDSTKLQAIFTLGVLVMYKLLPPTSDASQPALMQSMQTIENVIEGPIDYEVFSQPRFEWDTYQT